MNQDNEISVQYAEERLYDFQFIVLCHCFIVFFFCPPAYTIHFILLWHNIYMVQ